MAGVALICYCCCCGCFCFILSGFIWFILLIFGHFFISIKENETYIEGFWGWLYYIYTLVYYCFEKVWDVYYFLLINFIWFLPYMIIMYIIHVFQNFLLKKIEEIKGIQKEMMIVRSSPNLSFFVERLKTMKFTLFSLFGFLIALRIFSYLIYDDNFVMGIITYYYMAFFMAILMIKNAKNHIGPSSDRTGIIMKRIFMYNIFLIFVSAFIINDVLHFITENSYYLY